MNFIGNRNFRAGPQTSLEGFICPQNSDKQQKIKVFGRSGGGRNRQKQSSRYGKENANTRHREVAQRRKENTTTLTRRNWRVHQHNHHTS